MVLNKSGEGEGEEEEERSHRWVPLMTIRIIAVKPSITVRAGVFSGESCVRAKTGDQQQQQ